VTTSLYYAMETINAFYLIQCILNVIVMQCNWIYWTYSVH